MGQDECLKFFAKKENRDRWIRTKEVAEALGQAGNVVSRSLSTLNKHKELMRRPSKTRGDEWRAWT